jgi:rod shape-determining protein MreC
MRNVYLFIRRYSNFLFFLLLQVFCIYLIVRYNKYHNAVGSAAMNEVTGRVNKQYNKIDNFFQLGQKNDELRKQNERLLNMQHSSFENTDTANKIVTDSIPFDTLGNKRKWLYQTAKVVSNSVTAQNNFVVLNRGAAQQLGKDEGVIDANNAVIGTVTEVSANFAVVMSLLHKDSKLTAVLKNDSSSGGLIVWDGKEPNYLSLQNVRQSAKAKKGDTVLASTITGKFPPGMIIGTIDEIKRDVSTNNFIIKVKSAANFYNLQYAYGIKNFQKEEIEKLLQKVQEPDKKANQ